MPWFIAAPLVCLLVFAAVYILAETVARGDRFKHKRSGLDYPE